MALALKYVNGIPRTSTIETDITYYDVSIETTQPIGIEDAGKYNAAHTRYYLQNGEVYDGTVDQLKVQVNGISVEDGVDFDYQNSANAVYVDFYSAIIQDARIRFYKEIWEGVSYYDESILVSTVIGVAGAGYNSAHTVFTLPNAKNYNGFSRELKLLVNGIGQHWDGIDFSYEASANAITVTLIEPAPKNARIRFILTT